MVDPVAARRAAWDCFAITVNPRRFRATAGFGVGLLGSIYERYCGAGTPIKKPYVAAYRACARPPSVAFATCRHQLYRVYEYLKLYQCAGVTSSREFDRVWHRIEWLASVLDEIRPVTDAGEAGAFLPADLFPGTIGSVDTVPVYVRKPQNRDLNRATYSGKYKGCVVKFQVCISRHVLLLLQE